MPSLQLFLAPLLFSITTLAQWPNPEPCSGFCNVHDPSLVRRDDGTYFLFGSGPNLSLRKSPSINGNWSNIQGGFIPANGTQLGAPDVQKGLDGTYYMYYQHTVIGTQKSNISWAYSQTLEPGSWTFGGHVVDLPPGNAKNNYNRLDPNLLVLNNGSKLYLSFGSYWDDIFQFKMKNISNTKPDSLRHLAENITTYDPKKRNVGANPLEGSYQFTWQINNTMQYYLFFSSGACCKNSSVVPLGDEYKVMVCRSSKPTGPFSDRVGKSCLTQNGGTLILGSHDEVYAPGGQGVMYDEGLARVIIYYHYLNAKNESAKALFGWNYLNFDAAGWPYVTTASGNAPVMSNSSSSSSPEQSSMASNVATLESIIFLPMRIFLRFGRKWLL